MSATSSKDTSLQRRSDTRRRIQEVALDLFSEQGYEKTSLREIAERLDVTKAALYYHFRTKEDIVVSLFEDLTKPVEDLIEWGRRQEPTLETKQEVVRRYNRSLLDAAPLFRFVQANQATVRELSIGAPWKGCLTGLHSILADPETDLLDQARSLSAILTLHAGAFALHDLEGDPEAKREAALEVALDLVEQAHNRVRSRPTISGEQ
ncbi:TetR/AcrR family transcriptional regulator [Streptomyces sp. NPDC001443]